MYEKRKRTGSRLHPDLVAMIGHYVIDKRWTNAAQLHRQLMTDLRDHPLLGAEVPEDPRSIRTWMRRFQSQDTSGTWTLPDADDTDPVAVLAVLAAMLDDAAEQSTTVTNGEARIISSLFRLDASIPPLEALRLARRYLSQQDREAPTDGLDRYVAVRGWKLLPDEYHEYQDRGLFEGVGKHYVLAGAASGRGTAHDAVIRTDEPELSFTGELSANRLEGGRT